MSAIYTRPQQTGMESAKSHGNRWIGRTLSRRQLMRSAAGVTGLGLGLPQIGRGADADPKPIPGGIQPFGPGTEIFHVILPGPGNDPSKITDLNDFLHGPSEPATVPFAVRWSGPTRRQHIGDRRAGFAVDFIENRAPLEWSARAIGFEFTSDPAETSRSFGGPFGASGAVLFAGIGHERNGVFFGEVMGRD